MLLLAEYFQFNSLQFYLYSAKSEQDLMAFHRNLKVLGKMSNHLSFQV